MPNLENIVAEMEAAVGVLILIRDLAERRGIDVLLKELTEALKEHPGARDMTGYEEKIKGAWESLLLTATKLSKFEVVKRERMSGRLEP